MSAWLCDDELIAQVVACGLIGQHADDSLAHAAGFDRDSMSEARIDPEGFANALALVLRAENYRSLIARYGAEDPHWSPIEGEAAPFRITLGELERARQIPIGFAAKMLDCLEYQSCEARDWNETRAKKICDAIRHNLLRRADGYNAAPWGDAFPFAGPAPELISLSALARRPRKSAS